MKMCERIYLENDIVDLEVTHDWDVEDSCVGGDFTDVSVSFDDYRAKGLHIEWCARGGVIL